MEDHKSTEGGTSLPEINNNQTTSMQEKNIAQAKVLPSSNIDVHYMSQPNQNHLFQNQHSRPVTNNTSSAATSTRPKRLIEA